MGDRRPLLGLAVASNYVQLSARLSVSLLVPSVLYAFEVSASIVGVALTLMWAAYALVQYPSGVLTARHGGQRVVVAGLFSIAVGSLVLAVSPGIYVFTVAVVLIGIGAGLYFTAGANLLSERFEETGRILGFHTAGAAFGGVVTPTVVAYVAVSFGWRVAALLGTVLAFPLAVLFAIQTDTASPPAPTGPEESIFVRMQDLYFRADVVHTIFVGAVGSFAFQAFAAFYPTFLVTRWGFTSSQAGIVFSTVFLLGTVSLPALGRASDRVGRDWMLMASLLLLAAGFVVALRGGSVVFVATSVTLIGVGLAQGGIVQARAIDVLGADEQEMGFGLLRTSYVALGALGSVVTGTLMESAGWTAAYGFVVVLLLVAVFSLALANLVD